MRGNRSIRRKLLLTMLLPSGAALLLACAAVIVSGRIAGIILALAMLVAVALSYRLERLISEPILELARLAKIVSVERNYGVRAVPRGHDGIGLLMESFNEMLAHIESRERQAAESIEANRAAEQRFGKLAECAPGGILQTDAAGRCTYINQRWVEITGLDAEKSLGEGWKSAVHPDHFEALERDMAAAAHDNGEFSREVRLRRAEGEARWMRLSGRALVTESGQFAGFVGAARDITERMLAEAEKARLTSIIEATTDYVAIADLSGRILYLNRGGRKLLGFGENEDLPDKINMDFHPAWAAQLVRNEGMPTALRRGSWRGDTAVITRDGREVPVSAVILSHKSADGTVQFTSTIMRDITHRKLAEASLREKEYLLSQSQRIAHIGGWSLDLATQSLTWTKETYSIHGVSPDTFTPSVESLIGLIHPDDRGVIREGLGATAAGHLPAPFEFRALRPDGTTRILSGQGEIVSRNDTQPPILIGTVQDITEQKRAEEALRTNEAKYRRLFEDSRDALMTLAPPSWAFTSGNPAAIQMFRAKDEEAFVSYGPWDLSPERQPDGRASAEKAKEMIETAMREGSHFFEWTHRRLDGEVFSADVLLTRVEQGEKAMVQATVRDITERKRTEEALRHAMEAAEAGSRAKSEFLANMSHEIRTPLNAIVGMTDLALDTELTAEQREYLNTAKSATESLLTVINDILDFSKMEAGKLEMDRRDFPLRETLDDTMKMLALRAHEKGLELAGRIPQGMPEVLFGDPDRLRQILVNLAGNAIKFTATGEVIVNVEADSQTEKEVVLHFTVKDTGVGIPAEKQQAIFQAFTQADASTTRKYGGTGLGLAIASRLVKMMGGRLWLESEEGRGSTFHFTALFGVQWQPAAPSLPKAAVNLIGLPVLVVDDNFANRRILEEMLVKWAMLPTAVSSGPLALAALDRARQAGEPFPLVLLDAHMPGMDGFEVAERIRREPAWSGATIMMLTSDDRPEDVARCRELGIRAFLVKPIRRAELLEAILTGLGGLTPDHGRPGLLNGHKDRRGGRKLRILLAEDNPVNQMVALRLLQKHGHHVTVVGNGREALLLLEKHAFQGFDLVLMDVQMPEMDGLTAAAAIRQEESGSGRRIPIVAMTAHAMAGDRECCLGAGMDAYIAKPVRAQELFDVIESVAGGGGTEPAPPVPPSDDKADPPGAPAWFASGEDAEFERELSELFLEISPRQMTDIRDAVGRGEAVALEEAAHALKGCVGHFAAPGAFQAAQELEYMARNGDLIRAEDTYRVLEKEILKLRAALSGRGRECAL